MAGLEGKILERYELRQLVGRGGMADVYVADDLSFGRQVAVKVFKRDDEELLRRFVREARLMETLGHPHLMPIYDTGEGKIDGINYYYIVMPFMDGGTLRARIRRGPIPLNDVCYYIRAIASALDYVHAQGIIHRDIKSSNILLSTNGACYLADFGIARMTTEATQLTSTGNVLGTIDYIAPELFEPHRRADALSDLYSLGILLYEMVTGRLPFTAENQIALVAMHVNRQPPVPRLFVPTLPPQAEQVLLKGLAKLPEQRYQSATELAEAFCQAATTRRSSGVYENDGVVAAPHTQNERLAPLPGYAGTQADAPTVAVSPPQPAEYARATGVSRSAQQKVPIERPMTPAKAQTKRIRRPASPARVRARIVTIMALLMLLAIVSLVVYAVTTHPLSGTRGAVTGAPTQGATSGRTQGTTSTSTTTPNLTGTAQAAANATQQAKNAAATAIARPTVTAQAQASATAGVLPTALAGKNPYQDPLTDPTNAETVKAQWDQNGNCNFDTSGYHVTTGTALNGDGQLKGCREAAAAYTYQNFAASVDVTILSGHTGGLFFRVGTKPFGAYSGYLFEIDSQGNYKISSSGNFSTGGGNNVIQDWTATKALHTGNTAKNTLQVIARDSTLAFYANSSFLGSFQDSSFSRGNIGFLATTASNGANADVVYDNLKVVALA